MITGPLDILFFLTLQALSALIIAAPISFIIGWAAKKRGKNPLIWGLIASTTIAVVLWFIFPNLVQGVANRGLSYISNLQEKTVFVQLKDADKVIIQQNINGVDFDIPLPYMKTQYRYDSNMHGWKNVTKSEYDRKVRHNSKLFTITALLPNLEPMSELNYQEFEKPDNGLEVNITLSYPTKKIEDFYFKDSYFASLTKQGDDTDVPGMLYLLDKDQNRWYFSHNYPVWNLTTIRCYKNHSTCTVDTVFEYNESHNYSLMYMFNREHLTEWREIDNKIKALFSDFSNAVVIHDK